MKTAWILLLMTHSCFNTTVKTRAYLTETDCQNAIIAENTKYHKSFTDVMGQCQSVDSLLQQASVKGR